MSSLGHIIRELRRRAVFRSAGLYGGACWIAVQAASILLPAFGAPPGVLRAIVVLAVIGFPVVLVVSWFYQLTTEGIVVRDSTAPSSAVALGGRKMDFVVIGILSVALVISATMHLLRNPTDRVEPDELISILVADFDNQTGDPVFEGSLEQALQLGMEGASFITAYRREAAKALAEERHSAATLDAAVAQLVALREGVKLVLAGSIAAMGDNYALSVRAIAPSNGALVAHTQASAETKLDVLEAMGRLTADLRRALGDQSRNLGSPETFTATSLEAVREYDRAQQLQFAGRYAEAIDHYRKAVEHDPSFGRAYSGWAVAARNLGRLEQSEMAWRQALSLLDTMMERERLRTLGAYYWGATRNYQKAIEAYTTLVERYPADSAGHNNLAVAYFLSLDLERALQQGRVALDIYPDNPVIRTNYALYAMYASDFDTAAAEARAVVTTGSSYHMAWLPIAMQELSTGNFDAAREAYRHMTAASSTGASYGNIGLADVEMYRGNFAAAREILREGIAVDDANGNSYGRTAKLVALADASFQLSDATAAIDALSRALDTRGNQGAAVQAALLYAERGQEQEAASIAEELSRQLEPQSRAYAELVRARIDSYAGRHLEALDRLNAALSLADLWLVRYYLGRTYLEGGYFAEAFDEFRLCRDRSGEATALFFDDLPTFRVLATLPYWLARSQQGLGMIDAAAENYRQFLGRRPRTDPLSTDAQQRLQAITESAETVRASPSVSRAFVVMI